MLQALHVGICIVVTYLFIIGCNKRVNNKQISLEGSMSEDIERNNKYIAVCKKRISYFIHGGCY
jgi:hypothetical protein